MVSYLMHLKTLLPNSQFPPIRGYDALKEAIRNASVRDIPV